MVVEDCGEEGGQGKEDTQKERTKQRSVKILLVFSGDCRIVLGTGLRRGGGGGCC